MRSLCMCHTLVCPAYSGMGSKMYLLDCFGLLPPTQPWMSQGLDTGERSYILNSPPMKVSEQTPTSLGAQVFNSLWNLSFELWFPYLSYIDILELHPFKHVYLIFIKKGQYAWGHRVLPRELSLIYKYHLCAHFCKGYGMDKNSFSLGVGWRAKHFQHYSCAKFHATKMKVQTVR